MKKNNLTASATLRQRALDRIQEESDPSSVSQLSESELRMLIHEFELQKIELKIQNEDLNIQNEELRLAKAEARAASESYIELYDLAPSGYITLSPSGIISKLNLLSAQMLGKERSHLMNCHFSRFLSSDTLLDFNDFLRRIFKGRSKESCELTLAPGEKPSIRIHMEGIRSEDGESCLAIFQDITPLKVSEYELLQSNERYKSLFLNNHTAMLIVDPDTGLIVDANPIACRYYGWTHVQICQMNISDINTLTPRELFIEMNLAKEEKRKYFFFKHRLANGEVREVEVHSGPIKFKGEELLYSHIQDITERNSMERALRKSEEKFSAAFQLSPYIITITSLEGGEIVEVNDKFISISGFSRDEAIGHTVTELGFWNKPEERNEWLVRELLESGSVSGIETQFYGKNGVVIDALYSASLIQINNSGQNYILASIEDITEQKKTQKALRLSEIKYRNLVENINDVIYEVNAKGIIKYISSPIYKILGYTSEEITGRNFAEFVGASSGPLMKRLAVLDEKSELEGEYQILKKTGEPCWVRISTKKIHENGAFLGGTGTIIDITERRNSEETLRKSSQKWEAIIATSTDGIGMASVDGKIQLLSDNLAIMCGYSTEEKNQFIGGSFFDFIDPSFHCQLAENLQKLLSDKKDNKIREYIAVKKDKSRFYVELNSTILLDSTGEPESILYFVRDITERKAIEKALIESEQKFKSIVQSQAEGIGLVNQYEIFEFVNPAAAKIFETTLDDLTGSSLHDYLDPDEIAKINHQTSERKNGITNDYELQIRTKAENIRFIEVSVSPRIDESNNYTGAYGIFRDITERKLAQEALKEKSTLLSNLIINMQEGILLEDSNRKIVLTNQLFCNMFSIPAPPELLVGSDCSESAEQTKSLFKDPEKFLTQIQKILADKKAILNDQLELADGRYFERDYIPTYHENAYNGHLWKYRDITQRKQSEYKISQQNERLNAIITAMPDLIFVLDQYGNNMEYYTNTPDKLLAPEDKLVSLNIETLFDPETAQYHLQKIKECIEQKRLVSYEYKVDQAHSPAFYEARLVPLGAANVLAFIRDVSEKKQQENEIKKLYTAIEQSPVSILITDLSARIGYVNPAFLKTTGYSSLEVIGNNPRILKSGKTDKSVYQDLWKTITSGNIWESEWQDKKKNGELFWEHVSINPIISEDGVITNYLGIKQDITQRKQAEEEIRNLNANLERRIAERTSQLSEINKVLQLEIAERKRASEAMSEALDRLNKIADRVPGAVYQYLLNPDGSSCFPYASEGIRDIYRVTPEEVAADGSVVYSRIHPDDFANVVASIQLSAENLTLWHHEYRVKFSDGTINWLLGNALPQRLADGGVLWHGFISDISGQKEIESALIASRQSYKMVVENIKEIIFQTDANGLWVFLNKAWEEITGFTVEESLGQLFVNFVHPDDRQRNMELFQPLIERKKDYCRHQVRYLTKEGGFRWIEVYARLGLDEHNEIIGTYGTLQDITERKEAEDHLEQLSFRLSLAVQAGRVGVWDYNLVNGNLTWDNQMFSMYGIKQDNFTNLYDSWQAGLHPDDRVRGDQEIQMAISGEKEFDTEFRVVWPDGTIRFIRAMAIVQRDSSGNPLNIIGTNWDITTQKRAAKFEQELLKLSIQLTGIPSTEISAALDRSLQQIGCFLSADRAYIFEFNLDKQTMSSTHEWCNEGIFAEKGNLQEIPYDAFPMWMKKLQWRENILIPSIQELPDSWRAEREMLEPRGIQSLLVIPILSEGIPIGFVRLDAVKKEKVYDASEINFLRVWSNMLSGLINNQRKEFELNLTRQNYETFFNTIEDFLFVLDEQGNIIHSNNSVNNRLGYSVDELMGQSVLMVHPPERREEAGRVVGEMLAGTSDFCPVPLMTKSKNQIPVETRVKQGFWDGRPVIFGVSKDVSKIQLSEEKFSKAFQFNSALMAISRAADNKFIEINDTFINKLEYSRTELIGKTSGELDLYADSGKRRLIIENLNRRTPVSEIEIEIRKKSGELIVGLFSADYIYIGNELCILAIMVDITERKQIEKEIIKARNEAETANLAKSEFLSRMSHELRTPMNSILGFAQLMELGGGLNSQQNKGLGHIMNSGRHLLNLINEVLEISRIEAGHLAISFEPVLLGNIIGEILDSIQPMAIDRDINFILLGSSVDQTFVISDYQRLKQVFLNLFSNSIKYNRKGGSVTIKTQILQELTDQNSSVRVSITDTGVGITPEDLPRLFKPFERIGAEKTQTEGTGLGLSVVQKLMDAMGGKIGVESVYGTGSTFWIELPGIENPLDKIRKKMTTEENLSASELHWGTILYIEDNASNIELVEQIIISQRPNVRLISNRYGNHAVSLALELEPDLILLDLNLPDINGDEVIRLLQEEEKTKNIPVVIISADAMALQLKKLLKAGARNYLTKPLDITAFLAEVDKWIGIFGRNHEEYPK